MLTKVSLTGADDLINPEDLLALSLEFPFVEWAILFSPKRTGSPRYPSAEWVAKLRDLWRKSFVNNKPQMRLAAHFCGQIARDTLAGKDNWLQDKIEFDRIQLNGYNAPADKAFIGMARLWPLEFILQVRKEDQLQIAATDAALINVQFNTGKASLLYDPSGGRGIETFKWPVNPQGVTMGYAGGIKPANVLEVLKEIGPVDAPFWIDMESGVRTADDKFDLAACRSILEQCKPFVQPE